jgi:hypothetical protein
MKTCNKCGEVKALEKFPKEPRMADGHINTCISCRRKRAVELRFAKIEQVREKDRNRTKKPSPEYFAEYRKRNPDKYEAQKAIAKAKRSGAVLSMPCFVCGALNSQAHHPDYSAPLSVVWLCGAHHKQAHAMVKNHDN